MLYNNNVCKLTVFKKYSNRSSTAALEWYLNNFFAEVGGRCWGGNFDFKVFIFSFFKNSTSLSLKKIWRGGLTLIVVIVFQHFGHLSTPDSDHRRLSRGKYSREL